MEGWYNRKLDNRGLDNRGLFNLLKKFAIIDIFYQNMGNGKFKPMNLSLPTLTDSLNSTSVTFADIDNDADFDIFITIFDGKNYLFEKNI